MEYYQKYPTTTCLDGLPTITFYDGEKVWINKSLKEKHFQQDPIFCWHRDLNYHRSYDYVIGKWRGPFSDVISIDLPTPFVEVKCRNAQGRTVSRMHHYITRSEKRKSQLPVQHNFTDDQMNVLMVGLDSLSSHLFKRAMPRTREFLLETMESVEMNSYNKVGDNTFPNLFALMTGMYQSDLPDWNQAQGFDAVPFIWTEFKAAGYKTQYASDRADFDAFSSPPTDSYNHPMAASLMKDKIAFNNNCFEDQIEVKLWLDLVKEFALDSTHSTGRFFSLVMMKRPTHDFPNQASAVDEHYRDFLRDIYELSLLNNTFLVFFGDHGPRKGAYRNTYEGSIEERAANMVIYVPPAFRQNHKDLYINLQTNANRLTTNFDIHKTLSSIATVNFNGSSRTGRGRGASLFSVIPPERTCSDVDISPHFCMCNGGIPIASSGNYDLLTSIGEHVVRQINAIVSSRQDVCVTLHLKQVTSLLLLSGSPSNNAVYRIMFTTDPSGAAFEATVEYSVSFHVFTYIKVLGFVSRTSAYRGLSDCVESDNVLRMYCHCRDLTE